MYLLRRGVAWACVNKGGCYSKYAARDPIRLRLRLLRLPMTAPPAPASGRRGKTLHSTGHGQTARREKRSTTIDQQLTRNVASTLN